MRKYDGGPAFPRINESEGYVLNVLESVYDYEGNCMPFAWIADQTKQTVKEVRRAARSLARKGLAKYERGLFDDDGRVAGSGYRCTKLGRDALTERNKEQAEAGEKT